MLFRFCMIPVSKFESNDVRQVFNKVLNELGHDKRQLTGPEMDEFVRESTAGLLDDGGNLTQRAISLIQKQYKALGGQKSPEEATGRDFVETLLKDIRNKNNSARNRQIENLVNNSPLVQSDIGRLIKAVFKQTGVNAGK